MGLLARIGISTLAGLLLLAMLLILFWPALAVAQGMDLPLPPVRVGDPPLTVPSPMPIQPDEDGEDPRDTPPPVFYGEEIDAETDSIIYVIDVSESMNFGGIAGTLIGSRLARAQAEVIVSVNGLPASFVFDVIAYSSPVYTNCFEGQGCVPATAQNKARLASWIMNWNPHSWTATGPAVATALQVQENLSVVLLTDGMPNYGIVLPRIAANPNATQAQQIIAQREAHRRVIREANTQGATIDVFGIQIRGDARAFCQAVASDAGGSYFDVP